MKYQNPPRKSVSWGNLFFKNTTSYYGTEKLTSRINTTGTKFLYTIAPEKNIAELTVNQITMILSLQNSLQKIGESWHQTHTPHSRFGKSNTPTSSKLLLRKIRKRFLELS